MSYDNHSTTLTVNGDATPGSGTVDVVCYFGSGATFGDKVLAGNVPVSDDGAFSTTALMRLIAGHACRLRAIPTGGESVDDVPAFAGPQIAVSEAGLPSGVVDGNANYPFDFYVYAESLTASAAPDSAGSCGPYAAPYDSSFGQGNFAIDCAGSLLGANMPSGATRSDVQIDGQNAYDAVTAVGLSIGIGDLTKFSFAICQRGPGPRRWRRDLRRDRELGYVCNPGVISADITELPGVRLYRRPTST